MLGDNKPPIPLTKLLKVQAGHVFLKEWITTQSGEVVSANP
jgi:hypothetical protein